jgi:parvulin-like peptidyl-prolyl isomerase
MIFGGMMKRMLLLPLIAAALPLAAQLATTPAAAPAAPQAADGDKPVAILNGETITAAKLDQLWSRVPKATKDQYSANGGKSAFLNNYIGKRLLVQEALKAGFDRKADVQFDVEAARESALFDRYVRDIVAAPYVPEAEVRKFYDDNPDTFRVPEKIKVRHIVMVGNPAAPNGKTKEQALERMKQISLELNAAFRGTGDSEAGKMARMRKFAELAARHSDDGSAQQGGDLGWVDKASIDGEFGEAAFALPVGTLSGIVETKYGYHLIYVEGKKPAGLMPYDDVKSELRELIMNQHQAEIVNAVQKLTTELRTASKVAVHPENIR